MAKHERFGLTKPRWVGYHTTIRAVNRLKSKPVVDKVLNLRPLFAIITSRCFEFAIERDRGTAAQRARSLRDARLGWPSE